MVLVYLRISQTDEFVDVLHKPLAALCVQDFVMVRKIVKDAIAAKNLGRFCTADFLFRLVLLNAEREEIGYVLVSLAHGFDGKKKASERVGHLL